MIFNNAAEKGSIISYLRLPILRYLQLYIQYILKLRVCNYSNEVQIYKKHNILTLKLYYYKNLINNVKNDIIILTIKTLGDD